MDVDAQTAIYLQRVMPRGAADASALYALIVFYVERSEQNQQGKPELDGPSSVSDTRQTCQCCNVRADTPRDVG